MQNHRHGYNQAACQDTGRVVCHDDADDEGDGQRGNHGQQRNDSPGSPVEVMVGGKSQHDGHNHHLHDTQKHAGDVYVDRFSGQQPHEGRREQGSQQGGDSGHGHTQGHVAFGQVADDVAGRTSRAASHEDHAQGQFFRQGQQSAEQPCQERHDEKLGQFAHENIFRVLQHRLEVGRAEGQSHAEHHHAQHRRDGRRAYPVERGGEEECHGGDQHHDEGDVCRNPGRELDEVIFHCF